ncbi:hypothetical protein SLEP1_g11135 [Rubroshorea leprosula]|uniref:Uncharacterized protein n=1 Tax=Rubroshorea leprosula TaxID=152421 RepID=A0AAV5IJS4_9ROSI|nr:hypothetical protein SLEP1_g11135 [Rubroshorea leprosula]
MQHKGPKRETVVLELSGDPVNTFHREFYRAVNSHDRKMY